MPPAAKSKGKGPAIPAQDEEEEESIALLLADPFKSSPHFGPLISGNNQDDESDDDETSAAHKKPWALLPFCNAPLIGYSLEALSAAKIDKVFIYASQASLEAIKTYVAQSDYADAPMQIFLRATAAITLGDVLREADALQLKSSFLLLRVGYVGNLDLRFYLDAFEAKKKKDANLCMDCLVTSTHKNLATRTTHLLGPHGRILHYARQPTYPRQTRWRFPKELLEEHPTASIRTDLTSIGCWVCTADVLPLFTENFDYQNMHNFIHGILTSDLLGKTITSSEVGSVTERTSQRALFIQDTRSYADASHELISRQFHPIVPDEALPSFGMHDNERYNSRKARVYVGRKVDIARSAKLSRALIGSESIIEASSVVSRAVLGNGCKIGPRSTCDNSFLGTQCLVGSGAILKDCILGNNVTIGKDCQLTGCLLADGVVVNDQVDAVGQCLSQEPWHAYAPTKQVKLGSAYVWPCYGEKSAIDDNDDEDSDDEDAIDPRNFRHARLWTGGRRYSTATTASAKSVSSISLLESSSDEEDGMSETSSLNVGGDLAELSLTGENHEFEEEMRASIERAFKEGHTVDNLIIELKTLRMSSNVPLDLVQESFTLYLVALLPKNATVKETYDTLSSLLEDWGDVYHKLSPPFTQSDQVSLILTLQSAYSTGQADQRSFLLWLRALYESDLIEVDAVVDWWKGEESRQFGDAGRELWSGAKPFVEKLLEASSDEEEDEED